MQRTLPKDTKLTICVWHPFSQWRPTPAMADAIRARWPEMRVAHLPDYERLPAELPDTDIFAGFSLRAAQLKDARNLKWIHATAAGVAQLAYPELRESGIMVTNSRGIFSVPMAEHTMGLMIALARNFPESSRHHLNGHWGQQDIWDLPQRLTELNGKLLLIVGFGSIGKELAKRAKSFEMRVWGVTLSGQADTSMAERVFSVARLHEALAEADYVVIAAPETAETKHLIGAEELARMRRGARLINVARGSLLDEIALIRALETQHLSGAALDVAPEEPLPKEHPLWKTPNLFITPHTSAVSDRLWERQTELMIGLLERWFDGRELFNRVDLSRGY
jgi:D-2-hydroxyacid dehydrogenase (NADP+)